MNHRGTPWAIALLMVLGSGGTALQAQQWMFGAGIADLAWDHFGIVGGCNENRGASRTVSVFGGRHVLAGLSLVATARVHYSRASLNGTCSELPPHPAGAGTYVFESGQNPLVRTFAATDLRLEYQPNFGAFAPLAAVGGGSVFWNAAPTPYWLVAGGLGIRRHPVRVSLIVEYQRYGLQLDRTQAVYDVDPSTGYPVLVAQNDLGTGRFWKGARLIALRFDFAVKTHR